MHVYCGTESDVASCLLRVSIVHLGVDVIHAVPFCTVVTLMIHTDSTRGSTVTKLQTDSPWGSTTGAVPATKPEATAIGRSARWPLENNLNVLMSAGFAYRNLGLLRYSRRHVNDVIGDFRPRPASA